MSGGRLNVLVVSMAMIPPAVCTRPLYARAPGRYKEEPARVRLIHPGGAAYVAGSGCRGVSWSLGRVIGSAKLPGVDSLPGLLTPAPLGLAGIIVAACAISSATMAF